MCVASILRLRRFIGSQTALNPLWRLDVGITHAIVILVQGKKPPLRTWMVDTERMETVTFLVDIHDEDDITRYSWVQLSEQLPEMLNTLAAWEETPHAQILICDDTGVNVCAAILTAYFIVRRQVRLIDLLDESE